MSNAPAQVGRTVRLDSICRIVQGGRHKLSGKHFSEDGGYPAYGAGGHNGNLPSYEFDEPAIVLSAIGARCGKCFQPSGRWSSLANTSVFFPDAKLADVRFLWYQLNDESSWHRSGTAQPYIKPSDIKARKVYLPPLAEQKRIAGILDAADALRAKRREALAQLDTLLQSTFLDMFGDPVTNPMGWEAPALCEVTEEIYRYPTYFGIVYENDGVPEIRGELIDGKNGGLDTGPGKLRFIAQSTSDRFPRTQLASGDLVMSVRGTIGKIGIVPAELVNANITENLIRISPARSIIDPVFLLHVGLGPYFINKLSEASSSTTIKTIRARDLAAISIPLPPLDLQRRFAAIVESIGEQEASQRAHLAELDTLFASLQSRAFRGEL